MKKLIPVLIILSLVLTACGSSPSASSATSRSTCNSASGS